MARVKMITTVLRHPETGHTVEFSNDPTIRDDSNGAAMLVADGDDYDDAGFCDRFTARAFWKRLTRKGYRRVC